MYDELFENPAVVARYRAGPYAKSREQFLKKAQANGYSPRTLMRMAWALQVVAEIVRDAGGSITPERLRSALYRQVKSKWAGHPPSRHTIKLILQAGVPWLRNLGGLIVKPKRPRDLQRNWSLSTTTAASNACVIFVRHVRGADIGLCS